MVAGAVDRRRGDGCGERGGRKTRRRGLLTPPRPGDAHPSALVELYLCGVPLLLPHAHRALEATLLRPALRAEERLPRGPRALSKGGYRGAAARRGGRGTGGPTRGCGRGGVRRASGSNRPAPERVAAPGPQGTVSAGAGPGGAGARPLPLPSHPHRFSRVSRYVPMCTASTGIGLPATWRRRRRRSPAWRGSHK